MDTWAPLRRSLIICYFLWVRVCFLRVCDHDIPAAETWEGVTYETLDSALSGDWGVLKCQNSNFLQTVTPSHTLWPSASLSHSTTHSAPKSDHPELASSFFFYPKHCLSFSLRSKREGFFDWPLTAVVRHCATLAKDHGRCGFFRHINLHSVESLGVEEMNYVHYLNLNCCGPWPMSRLVLDFNLKSTKLVRWCWLKNTICIMLHV